MAPHHARVYIQKKFHHIACHPDEPPGPSTAAVTRETMRNYKKKGGHGGRREGAGLQPGHWERQGGRKAASAARTQRLVAEQAAAVKAKELWSQWSALAAKQQAAAAAAAAAAEQPDQQSNLQ